jgi:hypothetical protein
MSPFVLATGALIADPQRRTSQSGKAFLTATLRTPTEEDAALLSVIAFDPDACAGLLNLSKGDSCSITGRAGAASPAGPSSTSWIAKRRRAAAGVKRGCRARHERLRSEQAAHRNGQRSRGREVTAL